MAHNEEHMKPLFLRAFALLTFGLTLSACNEPALPGETYTVSGNVFAPTPAGAVTGSAISSGKVQAQSLGAGDWSAPHVAGEVLIAAGDVKLAAQRLGASALSALSGVRTQALSAQSLTLAYTPAGQDDAAFAAQLAASGLTVQPNYRYVALAIPSDPGFPGRAGIALQGVKVFQTYLTRINAQAGWDQLAAQGKTPLGARVAVLDTGVDNRHEDLAGRLLPGVDCSGVSSSGGTCTLGTPVLSGTNAGHGTADAGIIGAASNNKLGLTGLTWSGQNILPINVFNGDGATTASLAAGVNYATSQGAKVINMSLGLKGANPDKALAAAINKAAAADVLLVAAAGNTPNEGLYYPASDPNVVAVGALGDTDELVCYSARPSLGQKPLELVTPGGVGSVAGCGDPSDDLLTLTTTEKGKYELEAGTSFAAPQVSGAASAAAGAAARFGCPPDQELAAEQRSIGGGRTAAGRGRSRRGDPRRRGHARRPARVRLAGQLPPSGQCHAGRQSHQERRFFGSDRCGHAGSALPPQQPPGGRVHLAGQPDPGQRRQQRAIAPHRQWGQCAGYSDAVHSDTVNQTP